MKKWIIRFSILSSLINVFVLSAWAEVEPLLICQVATEIRDNTRVTFAINRDNSKADIFIGLLVQGDKQVVYFSVANKGTFDQAFESGNMSGILKGPQFKLEAGIYKDVAIYDLKYNALANLYEVRFALAGNLYPLLCVKPKTGFATKL